MCTDTAVFCRSKPVLQHCDLPHSPEFCRKSWDMRHKTVTDSKDLLYWAGVSWVSVVDPSAPVNKHTVCELLLCITRTVDTQCELPLCITRTVDTQCELPLFITRTVDTQCELPLFITRTVDTVCAAAVYHTYSGLDVQYVHTDCQLTRSTSSIN